MKQKKKFQTSAELLTEKFERLAARKCISSAEQAVMQLGCKTTAGINLATIDGCFVWAKSNGRKVSNFLPVFPETSVKDPNKKPHLFDNTVGEYFLYQNKLFYYDADKKNIAHIAVLYNSELAILKLRLKNELFMPRNTQLAKANVNGNSLYIWLLYDRYGSVELTPVFDQDYKKMLDKDGKELPKKEFSIFFLNLGQCVARKGKLYSVSYGAARTTLNYS